MTMPLDPNQARQKFYSDQLTGGCVIVAFYNHCGFDFSADDMQKLKDCAATHFRGVPLWPRGSGRIPEKLFWIVDITPTFLRLSQAMPLDESGRVVHVGHRQLDGFDGTTETVMKALQEEAQLWKSTAAANPEVDPRDSALHNRDVVHMQAENDILLGD